MNELEEYWEEVGEEGFNKSTIKEGQAIIIEIVKDENLSFEEVDNLRKNGKNIVGLMRGEGTIYTTFIPFVPKVSEKMKTAEEIAKLQDDLKCLLAGLLEGGDLPVWIRKEKKRIKDRIKELETMVMK